MVSCDSCSNAQRHSEYAAGAHWVWPHRLVTTIQHQTPNYQLTPEPTPTCLKAEWPAPPPPSLPTSLPPLSLLYSTQHWPPLPRNPRSILSKHAPWDAPWLHDIQMLRDILPHLCVSVRLSDPWTLHKRIKSICLCFFQAQPSAAVTTLSFKRNGKRLTGFGTKCSRNWELHFALCKKMRFFCQEAEMNSWGNWSSVYSRVSECN